jgi:hypothetical protein
VDKATKDTIPLWLAAAITVCVSLPFGTWLGNYNLPLWAAFIVWAEYFVLGARPSALRIMVPAYILGVIGATVIVTGYLLLAKGLGDVRLYTQSDVALFVSFFLGFCILIYAMRWLPVTQVGTLPFFNGISILLGVYFTGAFAKAVGTDIDASLLPSVAGVGAILAGLLGSFLAWFNVAIMFPREMSGELQESAAGSSGGDDARRD